MKAPWPMIPPHYVPHLLALKKSGDFELVKGEVLEFAQAELENITSPTALDFCWALECAAKKVVEKNKKNGGTKK